MTDRSANSVKCTPIDEELFDLGCLGPALAIILILSFFKRRENFKLEYCNGYPGLLIPVNILNSFSRHNRFSIAATFGATASTCVNLFVHTFFGNGDSGLITLTGPPWVKVFQSLVFVLVYGILFYPFFACLTTEYKLVGSFLGFLYATIRFSVKVGIDFKCINSYEGEAKKLLVYTRLAALPTYLCLLFVVIRFAVLLFLEVRKKWFQSTSHTKKAAQTSETRMVGESGMKHVKQLLNPGLNSDVREVPWRFMKLVFFIYKPREDFKFSTQLISTLVVAAIIIFQGSVADLIIFDTLKKSSLQFCEGRDTCRNWVRVLLGVIFDSWQAGFIVSALLSATFLLHFMKCHRDHVLQLYRGQRTFYQNVIVSPGKLVGRSLRFSGYQIAYTLAGYVILGMFLAYVFISIGVIFKFQAVGNLVKDRGLAFLPTVVMAFLLWLFQLFLAHFVFRDRDFPNIAITVDNRRLFSIMSYFFFFYNILLGLFSCVWRIVKGILLGVVFLSRIDRTSLMQGFEIWDQAFVAYLGFIHLLVAHSHPVMLMFCHLLINRNKDRGLEESQPQTQSPQDESSKETGNSKVYTRELRLPRLSHKAVNRWHVAVTLLRNQTLIKYRRQGGITPSVNLGSIYADLNVPNLV